jgi:hypothetical protein
MRLSCCFPFVLQPKRCCQEAKKMDRMFER